MNETDVPILSCSNEWNWCTYTVSCSNNLCKNYRSNTSVTMTPIKCRKHQKFAYRIFTCKISCHHYYVRISWHFNVMMMGNFSCTSENTISEFFALLKINWCHHYTCVIMTVFLHKYSRFIFIYVSIKWFKHTLSHSLSCTRWTFQSKCTTSSQL